VRARSNSIIEGAARRDSSGAKIRRQIELAVKQAFSCAVSLLPEPSAPKLRCELPKLLIGSYELIDYWIY
jgi:hypothetical protein